MFKKCFKTKHWLESKFYIFAANFTTVSDGEIIEEKKFITKNEINLHSSNIKLFFDSTIQSLKEIVNLMLNINRYAHLQGCLCTFTE